MELRYSPHHIFLLDSFVQIGLRAYAQCLRPTVLRSGTGITVILFAVVEFGQLKIITAIFVPSKVEAAGFCFCVSVGMPCFS
jgi:hypothetical protein